MTSSCLGFFSLSKMTSYCKVSKPWHLYSELYNRFEIQAPRQQCWWCACQVSKWYDDLTHWGRVTYICVSKLTTTGSDNGLSPGRRQAIIWTNDGILLIRTLGTNFSEILGEILSFSFKKMHLKMSSAKWRLFCLGLNVLNYQSHGFETWRDIRIRRLIGYWYRAMAYSCKMLTLVWLALESKYTLGDTWKRVIWACCNALWAVLEIPTGPPVRGRQLWRRSRNLFVDFSSIFSV